MIKLYTYLFNIIFYFSKNEKKIIDSNKTKLSIKKNLNKKYTNNIYRVPDIKFKIDEGPITF
jgi:hypothetical protein